MSDAPDFPRLCEEIKQLSGLTAGEEATLHEIAALILPSLDAVTDRLFAMAGAVPRTAALIEGCVESLEEAHRAWLRSLFTRNLDADFTQWIYQIGAVHAHAKLPVEFMTGGMSLVLRELLLLVGATTLDAETKIRVGAAIGSVCAFSQLVMQRSYRIASLASETERVVMITDISRQLFDRLAAVYKENARAARVFAKDPRADIRPRRRGRYATRIEFNRCRPRVPRSHA